MFVNFAMISLLFKHWYKQDNTYDLISININSDNPYNCFTWVVMSVFPNSLKFDQFVIMSVKF